MEIIKTRTNKPPRILIHADHGVGKSSLAAAASPIFIQTEDGLENIDTSALPLCKDFDTLMAQLTSIYQEEHDLKRSSSTAWTGRKHSSPNTFAKPATRSPFPISGMALAFKPCLKPLGAVRAP